MNRPFTSRRTHLLARSALCGVLAAMTMTASSALAQVTGVGTVTSTTSNGGAVGIASGGGVTDITTNASRSIVNWNALTVTPTEALNFHFDNRSDIVVNRVTGAASINGTLSGCVATCAVTGGNIWVLSTGGVLIGANAQVNTGGFLASTGSLSDADILDGDLNFAFTGAPTNSTISVANGASLNVSGGSLALIAPIVTTAAGSTVTATNGGDVIFGSAQNYNVTFAPTGTDDLDLLTFQVPSQSDGSNGTPGITLNGTTTANQVFAAVVSKASVATSILLGGNITATTASGENGDIVLSAGAGFTNGVGDTPMGFDAGITQNTTSTLTGANVTLRASDTIIADEINATGRVWLNSEWTSISQTGAITADRLRAEAGGDVILTNTGNDFNFLSYIEAQGVNGIGIVDLDGFVIDNYIFHLGGGARTANLTALTGSISATGSGVIQVGTLNVSAAGGGIDLGSAASNTTNLGTITAGAGEFRYRSLLDVSVAGVITASNVSLSSIAGQITQSGTGSILTGQLTASAGSGLSLNSVLNDVDTVTRLTSGSGDVAYTDADGFDLTGNVGGRGAVTLTAGGSGSITQSAGTIFADTLTALAGSGITLDQINQVVNIGDLTAGGSGDIVYRDADDFALTGNVSAVGNDVTFRSNTGAISQTSFSAITANRFTASAAGNITLFDGANTVATIGGLASVNGDIVYRDVDGFDIQGDITANGATMLGAMLVAGGTGGIIQTSGVFDVGYFRGLAGGSITLGGANQIRRLISTVISNGNLTLNTTTDFAVDGTVVANAVSLSSPGAITQNSNAQIWTTTLNASAVTGIDLIASGFGANNIGNLGVITNTTSGGIAIGNTYSTLNLTGNVTATGQAVSIANTMGAINQTGGVITAGSLSLSAAAGINASRNNVFGSLDAVTAGGDVAIVNVGDLTLTGDVNTSGNLTLTSLTGEIEQTGGVITAGRLNATGVGGIDFERANSVAALGTINAGAGAFTFQNLGSFQLDAAVSASSVDLTSNTGAITSGASGTISATDLTVSAVNGIDLSNANNVVANIAGLVNSTSGDLVYAQTNGFQITGAVTAVNQGMSLSSLNGSITQTAAGIITTDYLNASAGDDLVLGQANVVGGVGNLLAGGGAGDDLLFNSTLGFNINGTLGGDHVSLTSGGSIGQGATSRVIANLLTLDAAGAIALSNSSFGTGNDIDALGRVVTVGGAVSIGSISALDLTDGIDTNGGNLSLVSQLGITQPGGVLTVGTLSAQALTGGITLNRANQVAALGHIFADGASDFTFRNTGDIVLNGLTQASGNTISLISDTGAVVQNGPGMTAAMLSVSARTGINLGRTNNVGTLGGLTTTTGDITFRNLGSIAAPALTTPGTLTLISDNGSVTQTGVFNAASLFVSGQTGVALNTQVNDVDTVLGLASGAGDVLFRDADGFNLAGNVTSTDIVSLLNGTGSITQSAGIITTNLLSATSADNITLDRANQVSAIGSLIAGADITFASTLGLTVLNEITGDDVSVTSGGTFTQDNDGDVHASRLTIGAATGISLTNSGNTVSTIAGLSNSTSGGIAFGQTNGIQISGGVLATGQTVSLSSVSGAITQNSGSGIVAGTLNASAAGTLTLNQGNDVGNLGIIGTGGSFLFRDVNGFNLTGNVTVGSQLVMLAQNGSITQTGGIISSSDINALASVDVLLGSANQIGSISSLAAGRDLLYRQVGALSVPAINVGGALGLYSTTGSVTQTGQLIAGVLNAGAATGIDLSNSTNAFYGVGNVTNTTSGGISLKSQVGTTLSGSIAAAGQAVTLVSYAFSQQAAASITAGSLTGSTYTNANFSGVNDVDAFNFVSDQFLTFQDIDGFDIDGAVGASNVNLISGDAISQSVGGGIYAANLSLTAASANLLRDNDIQNLSAVSVSGNMTFRDINAISLPGDIVVDGILTLTASNGAIAQSGGRLDAGRLNASASQDIILSRQTNTIDRLGTITTTIGLIDIGTNGPLQIDGVVSAAGAGQSVFIRALDDSIGMTTNGRISAHDVSLLAARNVVLGNIDAGGTLDVTASAGSITSIAAPVIDADRFVGSATGDIVLGGSAVDFNRIGRVDAGGAFSIGGLVGDVDLTDTITATTVTLSTAGALSQSAGLITADAATLRGASVAIDRANAIDTVSLNGASVSFTNAGSFAANVIGGGAISLTSTTGKITQTASTGRVVANSLTASAATGLEFFGGQNDIAILAGLSSASGGITYRDTGGFDIAGNITAAGQAVELISDATGADGNDITQSGGVITANRLNGNSAGDVLLTQANAVGGLGLLNANGDFTYRGAAGVSLLDNLSAGSVLTLISDTGGIMQNGGVVTARTLNASSAFGVALSRQNDVNTLGDIDGGVGGFAFRDIDGLDLVGDIQADFGIILQTGGALSQSGGSLTTANLQLFSDGAAILNGNNDIDNLGGSNVLGALSFSDVDGFTIDAGIRTGTTLTLVATTGDIVELTGGALDAQTLNVTATAGEIDLSGDNTVVDVKDLKAGGDVTYHGADGFTLSGDIRGDAVRLTAAAGAINQTAGFIAAGDLYASAFTGLDLTSATNEVDTIVGLVNVTSGGISFRDADSVYLGGAVTASGQTVTLDAGGDLNTSGTAIITARRVQGSAVGAFDLGDAANVVTELGPITANSIAFATTSDLLLTNTLDATTSIALQAGGTLTQTATGTITGNILRARADGDLILDQANDLNAIQTLYSNLGDVTYADIDGFSLDAGSFNHIWTSGILTLTAGGIGDIDQTGAGLGAGTLVASAGGHISLTQVNHVTRLGALSAAGLIDYSDFDDIALTDDITAGGSFNIASTTGAVTQTSGLITATSISGQSADNFNLNSFDADVNLVVSTAGDVVIGNTGDIFVTGLVKASASHTVSLTTNGSIGQGAGGRIEAGTLNLSAGTFVALDGASRNDVDALGEVTAGATFAFIDDNDFTLNGAIDIGGGALGTTADLRSIAGRIDQTGGAIAVDGLNVVTATGADFSGANRVGTLGLASISGTAQFTNAQDLIVSGASSGGLVSIQTTDGQLTVAGPIAAGSIELTGADGVVASGLLLAAEDITVIATTGNASIDAVIAGDDVSILATNGFAQLGRATLDFGVDSEGDGQNLSITASGDAILGGASQAAIAGQTLTRTGGSGTVSIASTGGNAGVFLSSMDTRVDTLSAGGVAATASAVVTSGDVLLGTVSGENVLLKAIGGDVDVTAVAIGGGDYTLFGQDVSSGAFGFTGTARDIVVTDTVGDLSLSDSMIAQRDLTILVQSGDLIGVGGAGLIAGAGGLGDLSIQADAIAIDTVGASGDVTLDAGAGGDVDVAMVAVGDDYTLKGGTFSAGALSPIGATAGTWNIINGGIFDFTGRTLTYNGDIAIHADDDIIGGSVQSIFGSVLIEGLDDIDIEGLYAATDVTVDAADDLILGSATASGGDITLTARSIAVEGFAEADGNVQVTSADGAADIEYASAGGDIVVSATDGDARIGQAILTGATGDLTVSATNGNATLGATDHTTIALNNGFDRAVASVGTVSVNASGGRVAVYLDHSESLDLVQGESVDVTIQNGDLTIDVLNALNGDVYAEALDGSLTVVDATAASGSVGLYAGGGALTLLGTIHGTTGITAQADGLLDGRSAISIDSGGDLELTGGTVLLNAISATGDILVEATDGDAYVAFADAGAALQVGSLTGDATLRGARAPDSIALFALNTVTFGADDRASITSANYGDTTGGCGCLGGISVISLDGNAVVNLDSVNGIFNVIGAAIDGNANVVLKTGDLTIAALAGFNIDAEAEGGAIEIGDAFLSGGDYRLKAQDFLGNALTPNLTSGTMNDYTLIDTLGSLDTGAISVVAQGNILIDVQGSGVLTGSAQLTSTDGDITLLARQIRVDSIDAAADVALNASAGVVDVLSAVTVGGDYTLIGQDFSSFALTPQGARAGTLTITDTLGGLSASDPLTYGGDINITAVDTLGFDTITSLNGDILLQASTVHSDALSAANGRIDVDASDGAVLVNSATAGNAIALRASGGRVALGSASLLGTGINALTLDSISGGDAYLGADSAGTIAATNVFTSAGSSTTARISAAAGDAFVNLDASDGLTSVQAARNVGVVVRTGALTIDSLSAFTDASIAGGGDVRLTDATVGQDLTIDAAGTLSLDGPVGLYSGRIIADGDISLTAGGGIVQAATAGLEASGLTVDAGDDVSLIGANRVAVIRAVDVTGGDFAYRSTRQGGFDLSGSIDAAGHTVDLHATNGGISQSGGVILADRLTGSSDGGVYLAGGNLIGQLGDFTNTGGAFFLNVDQALTIVGTVDSTAALKIQSQTMTIATTGTVRSMTSGDAVILASDGVFTNNSGTDGVQAANGRWLIYSQAAGNPGGSTSGNVSGGLAGKSFYGSAYDFATGAFSVTASVGNRFVYAYQPTLTVTPISQQVTYNAQIPTLGSTIAGLINGDRAADAWSGAPTLSGATSRNVGTYGLSATPGSLLSDMNYAFAFGSGTLTIDPKALTATVTAASKTYDGLTDATGSITLNGVVAGDVVGASAAGFSFADRNAGPGKVVTALGAALSGVDAGNYTLGSVGTGNANILRRSLSGTLSANSRTYDGTTAATGSIGLIGVVAGDGVSASGILNFADKSAGLGRTVTASGLALSGADAGNYDLGSVGTGLADILRRSLSGTLTANSRTYDGTTAATGSIGLTGVVSGDAVSASGTLSFADKNAGMGRTVTVTGLAISGADAGNYALGTVGPTVADILRRGVSGTLLANSRTYDGTTAATGSIDLTGVVAGDAVSASGTLIFANKNAAVGKVVTVLDAALAGADAGNYDLEPVGPTVADILRRSLSGTLTANSRTYDGTTAATGSIGLTGVVSGDAVSAAGTFSFADKTSGLGRTVTVSGLALSGADAGNYDLGSVGPTVADILRRAIGGAVVADNKTYDGSTAATGLVRLTDVVAGDDIRAGGTLAFDNRNAGVGRGVVATNATLSGTDAGNYALTGVANGIANILQRNLSVTADDQSKRFGQADPSLTYVVGIGGLVQGDALTGTLTRAPGEASGAYVIGQGDLSASSNYILNFTSGEFLIRIPPAGGVQSLQMLRGLGDDGSPFALDRDPSPGLIVDDGEGEQDSDAQAAVLSASN